MFLHDLFKGAGFLSSASINTNYFMYFGIFSHALHACVFIVAEYQHCLDTSNQIISDESQLLTPFTWFKTQVKNQLSSFSSSYSTG